MTIQGTDEGHSMKISVFGLGYVGVVTAACLSREGHEVIGVDVSDVKVDLINRGQSPIVEKDIGGFVKDAAESGRLSATADAAAAVAGSEMAIVCVGTPSRPTGALDTSYVEKVTARIGEALVGRETPFVLVFRSTMTPGTLRNVVVPILESAAGWTDEADISVLFHPEFLREGSAVWDFYNPPKIVVGEYVQGTAGALLNLYGDKYDAPRVVCDLEEAEMVKYCDNLFHALKITFANEIGQLCHALGVNSQTVMDIFCRDTKLNISSKYLKPGFAFGGSCLPKDLRAFLAASGERNVSLPTLENMMISNQKQIERALRMILAHGERRIGFYGISFKEGTDDLRESPYVELAERLLGKGCELRIFDEDVQYSRLVGGNRSFVEERLPHLAQLLSDDVSTLQDCLLLVLSHRAEPERIEAWLKEGKQIVDLTGRDDFRGREGFESIV